MSEFSLIFSNKVSQIRCLEPVSVLLENLRLHHVCIVSRYAVLCSHQIGAKISARA